MNVQWNKVTWYSKLIALVLFVALPFIGFWYGTKYGETVASLQAAPSSSFAVASGTQSDSDYYSNPAIWQVDQRPDAGFTIAHPLDFTADDNYAITPTTDWRVNSDNAPGIKRTSITIPSAFEPQTNFVDATLTVGNSGNSIAVADCLQPDQNSGEPGGAGAALDGATTTINGINFTIFKSASAGAGNYYETTSYRTLHAGECYAVEYTIHSSQIANYPTEYQLQPFDENKVSAVLDLMVGTFKFL